MAQTFKGILIKRRCKMADSVKSVIHAKDKDISVISSAGRDDHISLTDIARYRSDEPTAVISNRMRSKDTIEFLGLWEQLNNPDFKPVDSRSLKMEQ